MVPEFTSDRAEVLLITLDDLTIEEAETEATKSRSDTANQYLRWTLALLSLGAAGIHLAVMGDHFGETWYHGSFFAAVAWLQVAWAVAIVVKPSRRLLLAGIIGNLVVAEVWLVSRTIGIPIGPNSGEAESIAFADVLATIFEFLIVFGSLVLLRPRLLERPVRTSTAVAGVGAVGVLVASLATLSLTPAFASGHSHGGEAAAGHSHGGTGDMAAAGHEDGSGSHGHAVGATNVSVTADGTSACEQSGTAVEGNSGHGHRGPVPFSPLTPAERVTFAGQVAQSNAVVLKYATVADAVAGGWRRVTPYVPCIAAHYLKGDALTNPFDPNEPEILLYDGTDPDSKIVGLSYLQFAGVGKAPEGFAGDNDPWHVHEYLCIGRGGVLGDSNVSEADCKARGGNRQKLNNLWMTHMWNVAGWDSRWGLFSSEHPDLGGRIGDITGAPRDGGDGDGPNTPSVQAKSS
jgi:hypothetical protein